MSEVHAGERADGAVRRGSGVAGALGAADWLGLAAAPSFAAMALLTAYSGGPEMACMSVQDVSPFTGMALMYLLMSVFHLAPWLKLLPSRRPARARHPVAASRVGQAERGGPRTTKRRTTSTL